MEESGERSPGATHHSGVQELGPPGVLSPGGLFIRLGGSSGHLGFLHSAVPSWEPESIDLT